VVSGDGLPRLCGLALEWIEGASLASLMASSLEVVTLQDRLSYARQITVVLNALHSSPKQIIHRDLKPSNIMVSMPSKRVVIVDFGLAREAADHTRHVGAGTELYLSPEQMENKPCTRKVDVYAFGITLPQLITGRPWMLMDNKFVPQTARFPPFSPQNVCQLVEDLARSCVSADPSKRPEFKDIGTSLDTISALFESELIRKSPPQQHPQPQPQQPIPRKEQQ